MKAASLGHAIILAGGRGARLSPHTVARPKPLTRLGSSSILEIILRQLRSRGVGRVTLCVSYLAEMIMNECGDGRRFGIEVDYCVDTEPRGTAGPLAAVRDWTSPAVVMNADILTRLNFADLFDCHMANSALLTVAAHVQELCVDYGVLHIARGEVMALVEKPTLELSISAGIYVASPEIRDHLPASGPFGINDLVHELLRRGQAVRAYGFSEEWYDIGTPERLAAARRSFVAAPAAYLPLAMQGDRRTPEADHETDELVGYAPDGH